MGLVPVVHGEAWDESVTLDPDACAEVWQQVQRDGGQEVAGAPFTPTAAMAESKRWQAVVQAAGTPMMPVLLLGWLQEINPLISMTEYPGRYAEALGICEQAFAGDAVACRLLSEALRRGAFESGLLMYCSVEAAQKWASLGAGVRGE